MRLRLPGMRALAARRRRVVRAWLDRRVPREAPRITLHRRRLYILPTRTGYTFGATIVVLLLGSLNYGTSLGFAVTFLLAGTGVLGMLHTYRNLVGTILTFAPAPAVFAGETARFPVRIEAPERARWALELTGGSTACDGLAPAPDRPAITEVGLATSARGRLRPPRLALATSWPLALFRAWSWVWPTVEALVYPAPVDHGHALPQAGGSGGGHAATAGGEEFTGLRDYHPGDPPRRIAWKALARTDELRVKAFESEPAGDTWLSWDALGALPPTARFEQLCAWVLAAAAADRRYGLALPDRRVPPGRGPGHRRECLEALALALPEAG
ncbi:MAG: DUF58 domain-containing protein [Halofilum sp. (in: g-proteobacteria)]|nr:DUF58 domain-containing protein [Halofilum sp. (in: g-proteobacteria)]